MSCIRPMAPLGETAFGSPLLSALMTTSIHLAGKPKTLRRFDNVRLKPVESGGLDVRDDDSRREDKGTQSTHSGASLSITWALDTGPK